MTMAPIDRSSPSLAEFADPSASPTPDHVAVILDGAEAWAARHGRSVAEGEEQGISQLESAIFAFQERSVRTVTFYTFPSGDRERSLPTRIARSLAAKADLWARRGVRFVAIGDIDALTDEAADDVKKLIEVTRGGAGLTVALPVSYGGRHDMVRAIQALVVRARAGYIAPEDVTHEAVRRCLSTSDLPDPDLVIRTGGAHRLSDFLLFECAYAELFFTEVLWPDFGAAVLDEALSAFSRRQRRFGKTGAQIESLRRASAV